jgi:hypothetical protein
MKPQIVTFCLAVGLVGCGGNRPEPRTVRDVASGLQREGIRYQTSEPVDLSKMTHAKVEESLLLKGENLWVEILRIEDERTFKAFAASGVMLAGVEQKTGKPLPGRPRTYVHRPFVVVVRGEPQERSVKAALQKIFPGPQD